MEPEPIWTYSPTTWPCSPFPGAKLEAYTKRIEALAKANAVLSKFHQIRRRDIAAGGTPTIKDSLAALAP